jgi:hypothetical protein
VPAESDRTDARQTRQVLHSKAGHLHASDQNRMHFPARNSFVGAPFLNGTFALQRSFQQAHPAPFLDFSIRMNGFQ